MLVQPGIYPIQRQQRSVLTLFHWNRFSAFAIIVALPVAVIYIALQKYIVGGLTTGGVKG